MGCGVWGMGCRVSSVGCGVQGVGCEGAAPILEEHRHDGLEHVEPCLHPAISVRRGHTPTPPRRHYRQAPSAAGTRGTLPALQQRPRRQEGCAPCTLHPAPCNLHPAPCTLHPAPCLHNHSCTTLPEHPRHHRRVIRHYRHVSTPSTLNPALVLFKSHLGPWKNLRVHTLI